MFSHLSLLTILFSSVQLLCWLKSQLSFAKGIYSTAYWLYMHECLPDTFYPLFLNSSSPKPHPLQWPLFPWIGLMSTPLPNLGGRYVITAFLCWPSFDGFHFPWGENPYSWTWLTSAAVTWSLLLFPPLPLKLASYTLCIPGTGTEFTAVPWRSHIFLIYK